MGLSHRHHYIPQFLINHFADEDGLLYIYDKTTGRFWKDKKLAKAIFFEMNRNTVTIDGNPNDNMEKLYADADSYLSPVIAEVLTSKMLTPESIIGIFFLASSLKLRIPAIDNEFNVLKETFDNAKLPIEIIIKMSRELADKAAVNHLLNSETFKESKRVLFPVLPFYKGNKIDVDLLESLYKFSYLHVNDKTNALLGDTPVLEKKIASLQEVNDFMFPLSANSLFIYNRNKGTKPKDITFYINKDLAIMHQTKQFIVCKEKQYLEKIIDAYQQVTAAGWTDFISDNIFNYE